MVNLFIMISRSFTNVLKSYCDKNDHGRSGNVLFAHTNEYYSSFTKNAIYPSNQAEAEGKERTEKD